MNNAEDEDTRYYVEIELSNLKVVKYAFSQKQNLDKGRQNNPNIHRLFLIKGQYNKFVNRCHAELASVLET